MTTIRFKFFLVILLALFFIQASVPPRLQTEIDKLNADTVLLHGEWGFCVMTADSGKIIASNNPQLSLMPASTLKLLTTGAALGLLGPDFKYETKIEYDGTYDSLNGIIHGNVYITGCGDPTFNSDRFKQPDTLSVFASLPFRLTRKGIKKIEGNIIGDASCFSDNPIPDDWTWSDIGQYYGAGVCGLAYADNSVSLYFDSSNGDSCTLTKTDPVPPNVVYRSKVIADGKKDEALVYGAPFGNIYYIYGNIPAQRKDYEVKAADPDPAYQCAVDFFNNVSAIGIKISGKATTVRKMQIAGEKYSNKRKKLTSVKSHPLSEIVHETNLHSDNIYAEQLLCTLGMLKGDSGTTEAGIRIVKNYWQSLGVNLDGLYLKDGCGLSRSDLVTTTIEASVLQKIYNQKWYSVFDASLPVAGQSGSMASLGKGTLAENNMHAKTGYINHARGYAGYVKTKSGKLLCFSLLANNYTCSPTEMKKRLEKVLVAMAELD
jgi:D-alanyl-D-alanine carboxypeptidase/D-alanyl-D-alanine-endopeptidase (penicillin-binding protein 4)